MDAKTKAVKYEGDVCIDLIGYSPMLQGDKLILNMPVTDLTLRHLCDDLRNMHLSDRQIDNIVDMIDREVRIATLSNMLAERMRMD